MSYKKRPDISTETPGEAVVQFDDGELAAIKCTPERCPISQNHIFAILARWVGEDGKTKNDRYGNPVVTEHRHSIPAAHVKEHGLPTLTRACLHAGLGVDMETRQVDDDVIAIVPLSPEVVHSISIRNAIDAAKRTFETIQTGDLL